MSTFSPAICGGATRLIVMFLRWRLVPVRLGYAGSSSRSLVHGATKGAAAYRDVTSCVWRDS